MNLFIYSNTYIGENCNETIEVSGCAECNIGGGTDPFGLEVTETSTTTTLAPGPCNVRGKQACSYHGKCTPNNINNTFTCFCVPPYTGSSKTHW